MIPFRNIFVLLFLTTVCSLASVSSKIQILHSSENIKLLAEKISQEYLYYYSRKADSLILEKIKKDVEELDNEIRSISLLTKDKKIKSILALFDYEKQNVEEILYQKVSRELASKMLDFSESISEGTIYLTQYAAYHYNYEEKMFLTNKNLEYLSYKILKYYIALCIDIDKLSLEGKMQEALDEFTQTTKFIEQYSYPKEYEKQEAELKQYAKLYHGLYEYVEYQKSPTIAIIMTSGLKKTIYKLSLYHQLNQ
jgi:hypothetical protein